MTTRGLLAPTEAFPKTKTPLRISAYCKHTSSFTRVPFARGEKKPPSEARHVVMALPHFALDDDGVAPWQNDAALSLRGGKAASRSRVQRNDPPFLAPGNVFTNEKIRGLISSVVSGSVSGGLNLAGQAFGLNAVVSALAFLYAFGSVFGYSLDIIFAKREFHIPQGYRGEKPYRGPVPYTDVGTRMIWLLRSFIDKQFFRFVITVIIDTLIGLAILRALIDFANERDFLTDFAYRDTFLAGGVAVFTFFLYNNVLRFDWAYSDQDSTLMNVVVQMWTALVLMIFSVSYNNSGARTRTRRADAPGEDGRTEGDSAATSPPDGSAPLERSDVLAAGPYTPALEAAH